MQKRYYQSLKLPESDKSLTRAISYSDLATSRRLFFQQSENSNGLIKQYSCEQIFDRQSNTRLVNVTTSITAQKTSLTNWRPNVDRFDSVENASWQKIPIKKPAIKYDNYKEKSLPMIELDSLKISDEPLSKRPKYKTEKVPNITQEIVKISPPKLNIMGKSSKNKLKLEKIESLIPMESSNLSGKYRKLFLKIFFFLLITIAAIITSSLISDLSKKPFNFNNSSIELRQKIIGQNEAINDIIDHFEKNLDDFTVVTLVGGTGVGKSLTANIIKKNFPFKQSIFEYFSPLDGPFPPSYNSLSFFHCNLVLLENLKNPDIPDLINFMRFWQEQKDKPCAMVLAIFNPEESNDRLEKYLDLSASLKNLQRNFKNARVQSKIIVYKSLDENALNECIKNEAIGIKKILTDEQLRDIRMHLLSTQSGCKGAYAKVSLLSSDL